jgi:hypothetical protein
MTIVAPPGSQLTPGFHSTADMETSTTTMTTEKKTKTKKTPRSATVVQPRETVEGHKTLRRILGRFHKDYAHLAITQVLVDKSKILTIGVKGKGSHNCPYVKREHTNNRIYFVIKFKQSSVSLKCHKCKDVVDILVKPLSLVEKFELVEGFRMETGAYHRQRPAAVPKEIVISSQERKKQEWEQRRAQFLMEKKEVM